MQHTIAPSPAPVHERWGGLADAVLAGHCLSADEGLAVLQSPDAELLGLLAAAYRVRYHWFGNRVHLNFLINAKSGACGEDCGYCSQSRRVAGRSRQLRTRRPGGDPRGGPTGRRPPGRNLLHRHVRPPAGPAGSWICWPTWCRRSRPNSRLRVCVSPGLLSPEQAARLKACGVDRVNHNLNMQPSDSIRRSAPRHSYQDRLDTLAAVRQAGLEICSGGIVGMGEEDADVVELALRTGRSCGPRPCRSISSSPSPARPWPAAAC